MSEDNASQRIEDALKLYGTACTEEADEACGKSVSFVSRVCAAILALLVFGYHADNAMAVVIEGAAFGDELTVSWEYDLHTGLGQIMVITESPVDEDDMYLSLTGLLPEYVSEGHVLSASILTFGCPPGKTLVTDQQGTVVENMSFMMCDPTLSGVALPPCTAIAPVMQEVERSATYVFSGVCFHLPLSKVSDFVSVAPLQCEQSDQDGDGDVDLKDFVDIQGTFVDPWKLGCLGQFDEDLTGPQ